MYGLWLIESTMYRSLVTRLYQQFHSAAHYQSMLRQNCYHRLGIQLLLVTLLFHLTLVSLLTWDRMYRRHVVVTCGQSMCCLEMVKFID